MSKENFKRFTFSMPIMKAYIEEGTNKRILEGIASTTDRDLHGDKMAPEAIKSMADSLKKMKKNSGTLNSEHNKSWESDLGDIVDLSANKKNELVMKAELNETSKANDLWYMITEKKKKLGLSIGGFVKRYRIEVDEKTEEYMRVFEDIILDHIAVTSSPANPNTWVSAIAKSINGVQLGALQEIGVDNFNKLNSDESMAKEITKDDTKVDETEETETEQETEEKDEEVSEETEVKDDEKSEEVSEGEADEEEEKSEGEDSEDSEESQEEETEEDKKEEEASTTEETEEDKSEAKDEDGDEDEEEKSFATKEEVNELKSKLEAGFAEIKALLSTSKSEDSEEESEEKEEEKEEEEVEDEGVELKKALETIDALKKDVDSLKKKSSTRKTASLEKFEKTEEVKESLEERLEKAKKEHKGDPNLFAILGDIRKEYKK